MLLFDVNNHIETTAIDITLVYKGNYLVKTTLYPYNKTKKYRKYSLFLSNF